MAALAGLAAVTLYARPLCFPMLEQDDFQILERSWTWPRTCAGLWVPNNEHTMPLGRLLTYGVVRLAGRPTALPAVAVLVGPAALLLALFLLYPFVRRELGHPLYGLVAVILFGVAAVYQQAVYWFAASFSVLALDTLLLALLAAQRWRQTGRSRYLILTILFCLLAPAWFASGILAGPLCCLYLLPPGQGDKGTRGQGDKGKKPLTLSPCHLVTVSPCHLLPLLGTALFLAVSLPRTAGAILHLEHYDGKSAVEAFQPLTGLGYACRSVVDNLLLGAVGVCTVEVPVPLVALVLLLAAAAVACWWRQAPSPRLPLLGLGLMGSSYLLTYSARAAWGYEGVMTQPNWSRYHLLPQLGLTLLVCGGLPGRAGRWFKPDESGCLTRRQTQVLTALVGLCFAVQLPRGLLCYYPYQPEQRAVLRRVEETDARCRKYHVAADAARLALPELSLQEWGSAVNGWTFLRGSETPRPMPAAEVRERLAGDP